MSLKVPFVIPFVTHSNVHIRGYIVLRKDREHTSHRGIFRHVREEIQYNSLVNLVTQRRSTLGNKFVEKDSREEFLVLLSVQYTNPQAAVTPQCLSNYLILPRPSETNFLNVTLY